MPTTQDDVAGFLDLIAAHTPTCVVAGGWGIDALVGRQTREHRDLDVLVPEDAVAAIVADLQGRGFITVTDWLPVRIELADPQRGAKIDVHPIHRGGRGLPASTGWWQHGLDGAFFTYLDGSMTTGRIDGREVLCLDVTRQREAHSGYAPRDEDRHDLRALDGVEPPDVPAAPELVGPARSAGAGAPSAAAVSRGESGPRSPGSTR